MKHTKQFKEHVLRADVRVEIGTSIKLKRQAKGYMKKLKTEGDVYASYLLWLNDWKWQLRDYAILAHEVSHLVDAILEEAGIEDDEARAYYIEYWMETILIWAEGKIKYSNLTK